jgi:hypothetical protein
VWVWGGPGERIVIAHGSHGNAPKPNATNPR